MRGHSEGPLLFSFCYLAFQQVLQLLALSVRSNDFKDLEIVVLLRSAALDSGQSTASARTLARVPDHARDLAALASTLGGASVDVRAPAWSSSASARRPSPGAPARTRERAMGLSAHRGRDEGPRPSVSPPRRCGPG